MATSEVSACRHRAVDHRLEHLRRDDDGLRHATGELDSALLHDRDGFERQLDTQIATGDHDRVERVDDLFERIDRLRLLDLRDDRNPDTLFGHDLVHAGDVGRVADERQRDQVGADAQAPAEVVLVLLAQRGDVHGDTGKVDALVVRHGSGDDDLRGDDDAIGLDDLDTHLAIVDQEEVTGLDVLRKTLEGRAADLLVADDVFGGDLEDVALGELVGAVLELAETDLRTLEVDEDGDGAAGIVRGTAHVGVVVLMHGVVAVAEVQACDIHPRIDQCAHRLIGGGGGAQGGDDFRASQQNSPG